MNKARVLQIEKKLFNKGFIETPLFLEVVGDKIIFPEHLLQAFDIALNKYEPVKSDFLDVTTVARLVPITEPFIKPINPEEGYNLIYIFENKQPIILLNDLK